MLNFLPSLVIGIIAVLLFALNVLFWPLLVFVFSLLKFMLPLTFLRRLFDRILPWLAENWISCNSAWMFLTQKTKWDIRGLTGLNYNDWYLIISNHQSWVDIFVLQHLFNRRIPLMKFFLKRELIWVPVMGIAWWALDFPFVRRYSAQYLKNHPRQKLKDFAATRIACEKLSNNPTSIMNFLEGMRFTKERHERQRSPYRYLMRPKAGGLALALNVLGDKFNSLLNVTIVYPEGVPSFWEFLCGRIQRVIVRIEQAKVPPELLHGDYEEDEAFRAAFQQWVQHLWQEKDLQIQSLMKEAVSG